MKSFFHERFSLSRYSQGTLTMFELLAFKPEVAKAIRVYVALAPVAFLGNISKELRKLADSKPVLKAALYTNVELTPDSPFNKIFSGIACSAFPGHTCKNALSVMMGVDEDQLNSSVNFSQLSFFLLIALFSLETSWKPLWENFLEGTSLPNFVHFLLNVRSNEFNTLDYLDQDTNLLCYNQTTPLTVPLEKITLEDMHLINSESDTMADPKDVERLKKALKGFYLPFNKSKLI